MLRTLKLLRSCKIIKDYEIIDFKKGRDFYFLKAKATLNDNSGLYIREFVSEHEYLYSYHWQNENRSIILRWDNAPHHKHIRTFPHHKHTPEIEDSEELTLEEVLKVIERELEKERTNEI